MVVENGQPRLPPAWAFAVACDEPQRHRRRHFGRAQHTPDPHGHTKPGPG